MLTNTQQELEKQFKEAILNVGLMRWKTLDDLTTAEMQVAADIIVKTCKAS